jgi:hypothetical protein
VTFTPSPEARRAAMARRLLGSAGRPVFRAVDFRDAGMIV